MKDMNAIKTNLGTIMLITVVTALVVVAIYDSINYGTYSSPW